LPLSVRRNELLRRISPLFKEHKWKSRKK